MMNNIKQYRIRCVNCEDFNQKLKTLFNKGFVFGINRYKTFEEIYEVWGTGKWWTYISVGSNDKCSKILGAGNFDYNYDIITIEQALKLDY